MPEEKASVKRALISVFDKTGIEKFAAALAEMGVEIISSGGTAKATEKANVPVRYVQEWTGFPQRLGPRVRPPNDSEWNARHPAESHHRQAVGLLA